jgi:hypothetical protein
MGAPDMAHRSGQDRAKAASRVPARKALGMSLLVSSRSGVGVTGAASGGGTGFRWDMSGAARFVGESMPSRLRRE